MMMDPRRIYKKLVIGRVELALDWRPADGFMGRFGGGWNWKLGFQASTPSEYGWTIIISLLVFSVSLSIRGRGAS